jgi:hypothetical protein
VLGAADVGRGDGASILRGVRGAEVVRPESFLFSFFSGEVKGLAGDLVESAGDLVESADELCDPDLTGDFP